MNNVLENASSIPAQGFQEVTQEKLGEMMHDGNTYDVKDLLDDEDGDESRWCSDLIQIRLSKVTTQTVILIRCLYLPSRDDPRHTS